MKRGGIWAYGYGDGLPVTGLFDPKRSGSRGFHEGIFDEGFGGFSTLKKKRRPEMGKNGMHGDAFTGQMCISVSGRWKFRPVGLLMQLTIVFDLTSNF